MTPKELRPGIYSVGVADPERRLFDELIPLPDGTSYNSYLIKGSQKTALIDTAYPPKQQELMNNVEQAQIKNIDYVIANHAEQDHSGAIPVVLKAYPEARVVTNPKCKAMLMDLFPIAGEKFMTVNDRETLSLGDRTLEFIYAPWVHWPETMFTYLREDKILFSCDFLGSHLATGDLFVKDEAKVYRAAKRYYAEIMMPFRPAIRKNLDKIKDLEIKIAAASHGPVYDRPEFILDAYGEWVSDEVKNEVVIHYVSMYGSTRRMVDHLTDAFVKKGITVKPFNLITTDIGELAMALVDAATVVIASPTVLVGPHPAAVYATYLVNALRPKTRFVSVIGSYGWGGRMVEQMKGSLANLQAQVLDPVVVKGYPEQKDLKSLDRLAHEIWLKHKENDIVKK